MNRKQLGALGEMKAAEYLTRQQYRIIHRNWRCRTGEIDLIAQDDEHLVFLEVRTRSGCSSFGTPEESVGFRKQLQVRETAQVYLHRYPQEVLQPRFDVISVVTDKEGGEPSIRHIKNAF